MNDERILNAILEMRNWIRASSFREVKTLLEEALVDEKSRIAYQMTDGQTSIGTIRKHCQMSPNRVGELQQRCCSMGLMEVTEHNRRRRLFDLNDFNMLPEQMAKSRDEETARKTNEQDGQSECVA